MKTTLQTQLRCYKCGSPDITTICHHCGRPMCAQHRPIHSSVSIFTENREFEQLNLGEWPLTVKEGNHCEFHVHSTLNYRRLLMIPGVILAIIGLVMLLIALPGLFACLSHPVEKYSVGPFSFAEILRDTAWYTQNPAALPIGQCYLPQMGSIGLSFARALLVMIAGVGTILAGVWLNRLKITEEVAGKPADLPISPANTGFAVMETMNVNYAFRQIGDLETSIDGEVTGFIRPGFRFMPADFRRLGEYQAKHHLAGSQGLIFQAGFLTLEGSTRIRPEKNWGTGSVASATYDERYQKNHTNRIWLESEIDRHPYFTGQKGRIDPTWDVLFEYKVEPVSAPWAKEWRNVPVRIIPRLIEKGKYRLVVLELQLKSSFFPELKSMVNLASDQVTMEQVIFLEHATLKIDPKKMGMPASDGVVELHQENDQNYYSVEWRGLWEPVSNQPVIVMTLPKLRFDQEIPPDACIEGELVLRIPALSSGIQHVNYFSALGNQVHGKDGSQTLPHNRFTRLVVKFSLQLPKIATTQLISRPIVPIVCNGGPTQNRIERIIRAINSNAMQDSTGQIYVRRVIENIPQFSDTSTGQQTRSAWDLSGRYYHMTYPVDFHVVVYGQGDENLGKTLIEITVQSQIEINENTNSDDRRYLSDTEDRLKNIINQACEASLQQETP